MKVTLCQSGVTRHDPELPARLRALGASVDFVECFDKCEICEKRVLARLNGATVAAKGPGELLSMVAELAGSEG